MPSVSSTGRWGGSGYWRVKGVLILLVLGLVYLAKETLLDEAEAFPTPGGEGSRSLVRESKMLIKESADRLTAQGPDPEGRPKSSGISLPSYELRLFPTTTQTFSMVRERKRKEVNNGERLLPAVNIPKTEISFECPTTKCKSSDCVVVFPVLLSKGLWAWNIYPKTGYQRFQVSPQMIAAIFPSLHKDRRSITTGQQLARALLPWYGIYVSQQEMIALSKIVENHLNVSNTAMLAEHKELQEVRTVALQNRMALDLLLAAQGGTCKVIGSECCSFISDATPEVMDMAHDTARGIKELHKTHGFAFGDLSGTFGSWGAGLIKLAVTISLFILAVLLLIACLVTVVKLIMKRITKAAL